MHLRAPDPQPPFLEMTLFTLPPVLGEALNADPHPPFIWNLLPASSVFFGRIPQTLAFCGEFGPNSFTWYVSAKSSVLAKCLKNLFKLEFAI